MASLDITALLAEILSKFSISSWIRFDGCADKSEHIKGSVCGKLAGSVRITPFHGSNKVPWNPAVSKVAAAAEAVMF